jgi:hypothetical protein
MAACCNFVVARQYSIFKDHPAEVARGQDLKDQNEPATKHWPLITYFGGPG